MAKLVAKGRRFIGFFVFAAFVVLMVLGLINVNKALISVAEARISQRAVYQINEVFAEIMQMDVTYSDLIEVTTGENGEITMLSANAILMNRIATEAAASAQDRISEMSSQGVSVPVGTALGVPMFSGVGPKMRFEVTPVGSVVMQFVTEFESAGINQTRHRISLEAYASVRIVIPTGVKLVTVRTSVLMAESILVGEVPDSYIQVQDQGDALNFMS